MSEEETRPTDFLEKFNNMKEQVPERKGTFLGEEGENFYVALSENEVYELSPLAYYVWLLCDGKNTINEIADRMSRDLKMNINEIIEPLLMALDGLTSVNLVVIKPE
ncbi:MAG: PqqD family protein [Thermoprotei archaeon]|nr:MAG: PqqD family protein [Thermoprotei archaeon]